MFNSIVSYSFSPSNDLSINKKLNLKRYAAAKEIQILEIITDEKFKDFHSIGIIDENAIRTFLIRNEYKLLRKNNTQLQSQYILSEKYNLAFGTVHTIIFRKRVKKTFNIEKYLETSPNL